MPAEWEKKLPKELRDYIEAERQAAHAAGYARAKLEQANYTSDLVAPHLFTGGTIVSEPPFPLRHSEATSKRIRDDYKPQLPRGIATTLVKEIMTSLARPASPTEVLHIIKTTRNMIIPYTTLRRGFDYLENEGFLERVGTTNSWRIVPPESKIVEIRKG